MSSFGTKGGRCRAGFPGMKNLNLGGYFPPLTFGAFQDTADGSPAQPSLALPFPAVFRFKWVVRSGTHSIQANVKQAINLSPRPTLVVKANPAIGINADVTVTAPSDTGWVVCGPATVTASATGVVFVELWSNTTSENAGPCMWDHIVVS